MATNSVPPPKRKMIVAPKVGDGRWKATMPPAHRDHD